MALVLAIGIMLSLYAAEHRFEDFALASLPLGVIPLIGAILGAWRLIAAWEAGPSRAHAVLAAFSLGLFSWSITGIAYVVHRSLGGAVLEFPSPLDIPNYASAIFWTIGVWLLYESAVDDFLDEVAHSSYFLTLITVAVFFTLTVSEGKDYGKVLWSGEQLVQHVTEALLPLAWAVNGFFIFRASRGRIGARFIGDRNALRAIALGLALATVSDLLFAAANEIGTRDPSSLLAFRNGGVSDLVAMAAYVWLAVGIIHVPLEDQLFHPPKPGAETQYVR
ncbi:MAG: hypothetical protein U0031_15115 [Thermomicrobiales bacterium]